MTLPLTPPMHTLAQLRSGQLAGTTHLQLAEGLQDFPADIFALSDTLEVLDLSNNQLSALPAELPRLHKLRVLFASNNRFTELPEVLGQCATLTMVGFKANQIRKVPAAALPPLLRWLILTDNQVTALPDALGACRALQKLMLSGNHLRSLPESLARCQGLALLRIAANQLEALPAWLLTLPRLSWLAFAGNPLCWQEEQQALQQDITPSVPWHSLALNHILGEGASGVIHHAQHTEGSRTQTVAVKLFKGKVTSDGLPASEMAACLQAGTHPHLVTSLGRVSAHPQGAQGLVMPLIGPSFVSLASPPSLASCTRDVYAPTLRLTTRNAWQMACAIASALHHLHQRGLTHGDVYGHNILHNGHGDVMLGDFGAASFSPSDMAIRYALQRLDVRAFGCLLEEWLERCDDQQPGDALLRQQLMRYKDRCLCEVVAERPLLSDIQSELTAANHTMTGV